jgi:Tol biopolymer transport system component
MSPFSRRTDLRCTFRRRFAKVLVWSAFLAAGLGLCAAASAQSKGGGKPTPPPPPNIPRPICFSSTNRSSTSQKPFQGVLKRADLNGTSIIAVNTGIHLTQWPRWSPDGSMIGGYHKTVNRDTALMVMSPDGTGERVVMTAGQFNAWNLSRPGVVGSRYPSNSRRDYPCWLGNNAFIFAGDTTYDAALLGGVPGETITATRLFIVDANGTIAPLTETAAQGVTTGDFNAHWSPSLDKIVFTGDRGIRQLFAINPDGTGLVQITLTGFAWIPDHAVWSPSGDRLAVGEGIYRSLWILDVDLSQPNPGTGEGGRVLAMLPFKAPLDGQVRTPSWSPDGQFLVYSSTQYETAGNYIVIADVATGNEHIVCGPTDTWGPDWDPLDLGL